MTQIPLLTGLVLAGGDSRRMGRDKGALRYARQPQAARIWALLVALCEDAFVSVRAEQAGRPPYDALPLIVDDGPMRGPAAGLLAAWERRPHAALLVAAVDMPGIDAALLDTLVAARDPGALATAFVHPDGTPEPLCTLWEPHARPLLAERRGPHGVSLRDVLAASRIRRIEPAEPSRLLSADSPAEYAALAGRIAPD